MSLFLARDYRAYMMEKIKENKGVRGYQSRLSEAAGVHSSYISRVINSHVQLTPDQAAGLAELWRLDPEESDYFIDLVSLERCTSPLLKKRITQRLHATRKNREQLSRRFTQSHQPTPAEQEQFNQYYSAWYFSAIHMLLTIPRFRTVPLIAERLQLNEALVESALLVLEKLGLAKQTQQPQRQWRALQVDLHVPHRHVWARIQHGHWRQKTSVKIQDADPEAIHYSGVHTLSLEDAQKLRYLILQFIEECREIITPSPEEELVYLGCDFYKV